MNSYSTVYFPKTGKPSNCLLYIQRYLVELYSSSKKKKKHINVFQLLPYGYCYWMQ